MPLITKKVKNKTDLERMENKEKTPQYTDTRTLNQI